MSDALVRAKLATRVTVGHLVHDCAARTAKPCACPEPCIVLAVTHDPRESDEAEDKVDDLYTIPRPWVQRVKVLR